jgi:hypothetical protein
VWRKIGRNALPIPHRPLSAPFAKLLDPQHPRRERLLGSAGDNAGMETNQAKVIELLREVHLIAFKEIERLNLRITELEDQSRQPIEKEIIKPTVPTSPPVNPPSLPKV